MCNKSTSVGCGVPGIPALQLQPHKCTRGPRHLNVPSSVNASWLLPPHLCVASYISTASSGLHHTHFEIQSHPWVRNSPPHRRNRQRSPLWQPPPARQTPSDGSAPRAQHFRHIQPSRWVSVALVLDHSAGVQQPRITGKRGSHHWETTVGTVPVSCLAGRISRLRFQSLQSVAGQGL